MLLIRKFTLLFLLLAVACTSLPHKDFEAVRIGMDKDQVLDIIGSPLKTKERKRKKVWIYRFYDKNKNKIMREVQLENDKVIYVGELITFDKIINPNGSSYSQEDLEKYILKEKKKSEPAKPDMHDMEQEMLKDLKSDDSFVPVSD